MIKKANIYTAHAVCTVYVYNQLLRSDYTTYLLLYDFRSLHTADNSENASEYYN